MAFFPSLLIFMSFGKISVPRSGMTNLKIPLHRDRFGSLHFVFKSHLDERRIIANLQGKSSRFGTPVNLWFIAHKAQLSSDESQ